MCSLAPYLTCVQFREDTPRDHYAYLVFGPHHPGQGLTVANTFRRLLLNDITGVAVTAARIDSHPNAAIEFASVPGIQETLLDICLNLRNLVFMDERENPQAERAFLSIPALSAEATPSTEHPLTPRVVTAAALQLPKGLTCVDPAQHIATLMSPQANLELTIILERGQGYRVWKKQTADLLNEFQDAEIGPLSTAPLMENEDPETEPPVGKFFPIDGIFFPVKKVNTLVETVDGEGEYAHFEVWTNGSLHPYDAMKEAAGLLNDIAQSCLRETSGEMEAVDMTNTSEVHTVPDFSRGQASKSINYEAILIEELEISLRAYNCLKRAQIFTLADLAKQSYESLLELRNFGQKSAEEVQTALATYGLELRHETDAGN